MRRALLLLLAVGLLAAPASAAGSRSFDGACEIAGPIEPAAPINVIPRFDARFSYHGKGSCGGVLNGRPRDDLRSRLDVDGARTLFDSCELGPDLGIPVTLSIRRARKRWVRFELTLQMIRVATIGPFVLEGAEGGRARGLAQLVPADLNAALAACGDPQGGITEAGLEASFETLATLRAG